MDKKIHTLIAKLRETVEKNPNKIAVQMKKTQLYEHYTYREFYQLAEKTAQTLQKIGIKKGDKIALVLENRLEWGGIYFGILLAGAIAIPLDPQSTQKEMNFYLNHSESKVVIASEYLLSLISDVNQENKNDQIIISDIIFHPIVENTPNRYDEQITEYKLFEPSPQDIASILYTSGTTGEPKGVILTHSNFYANFQSIENLKILSPEHNVLSILPLHHAFPFMVNLIIPLFAESTITYSPSLKGEDILECMRETDVTLLVGVPQIFYLFYRNIKDQIKKIPLLYRLPLKIFIELSWLIKKLTKINLSKLVLTKIHAPFGRNLKFFASGGAKLDETVATFLMKIGFTIIEGYGLTETSPIVTFNPLKKPKIGSAGKAIPNVLLKIIDPDEQGTGEIAICGPNIMLGYYKRPLETKEVLKDRWFYSGDLGYIDKKGYLYITGRKKELIILSSGKNISPEEVETYYTTSPFIKELCVLMIGKRTEEKLVAVIVPDFEYFRKKGMVTNIHHSIKWNLETLSKNYPSYKRIMGFIVTKHELPKTRLGKLKRFEIEEQYMDELMGITPKKPTEIMRLDEEDLKILASPTWDTLSTILSTTFNIKDVIQLNDHLELDLGIDSLNRVELTNALEKILNISIPDKAMAKIFTIKDLLQEIEQQLSGATLQIGQIPPPKSKESVWHEVLDISPPDSLMKRIAFSTGFIANLNTIIDYKILHFIFGLLWGFKVTGAKNLPKDKPFILCSNHNSYFDGFLIATALPLWLTKKLFFLGFRYYFELPIIRAIVKLFKIVPIDPNTQLIDAMQACAYILRNGFSLCIFPEGERSIDGTVKVFKPGIGILSKELRIQLVPVFIKGSYESWSRGKRFPRPYPIEIIFGKPCDFERLREKGLQLGAKDDYEAVALGIREEVIKLGQ